MADRSPPPPSDPPRAADPVARAMRWWSCSGLAGIAMGVIVGSRTEWVSSPSGQLLIAIFIGWATLMATAPWTIMVAIGRRRDETLRLARQVRQVARGEAMDRLDALLLERNDEIGTLSRAVHELARAKKAKVVEVETDPLTGLGNRRRLDRAGREFLGAQRRRDVDTIVAIAIDLDRFKPINDTLGHDVGDECLVHLGQTIRATVRAKDVAVRLGGDEFVVLLPGESIATASHLADRLARAYARQPWRHRAVDRPTLSIGVAVLGPDDSGGLHELLRRADSALYDSKRAGRDRVSAWSA